MTIQKKTNAYYDYLRCYNAMQNSPEILILIFQSIDSPQRPIPLNQMSRYNTLSSGEKIKVNIVYSLWNGTGSFSISDLYRIDYKDRAMLAATLAIPTAAYDKKIKPKGIKKESVKGSV